MPRCAMLYRAWWLASAGPLCHTCMGRNPPFRKTLVHEDLWNVAAEDSAQAVSDGFQWNLSSAQVGGCCGLGG